MAEKIEKERKGRILTNTKLGKFTLLNSEKLGRVLDLLEGIVDSANSMEGAVLVKAKKMKHEDAVLALYDRFGGAVRMGDRKVSMGTFYDFAAQEPIKGVNLSEKDFADEYVLVRKKTNKGGKRESPVERIKRLEARSAGKKEVPAEKPKAKSKK